MSDSTETQPRTTFSGYPAARTARRSRSTCATGCPRWSTSSATPARAARDLRVPAAARARPRQEDRPPQLRPRLRPLAARLRRRAAFSADALVHQEPEDQAVRGRGSATTRPSPTSGSAPTRIARATSPTSRTSPRAFRSRRTDSSRTTSSGSSMRPASACPPTTRWRTRSGCFFCFFQRKNEWVRLADEHPDLFEKAVAYEEKVELRGQGLEASLHLVTGREPARADRSPR